MTEQYSKIYELIRGDSVESVHYGAVAVVDNLGNLLASHGDAQVSTYLRSTAKPFQVLPFLEEGGQDVFGLTSHEIAIMTASHSGTSEHVSVVSSLQSKTGVDEDDLLCGVHPPFHKATAQALKEREEEITQNRHNCSGKHTGMLAYANMRKLPTADYINVHHPVQKRILSTFAEMCDLPVDEVGVGIDGCSAPNFSVPMFNAALALARLVDPVKGGVIQPARVQACAKIIRAMLENPAIVAGPERFDTRLMEVMQGRVVCKGGAEGYQGLCLLPGAIGERSPAIGITIKISDGDLKNRARSAVTIEVLRQLGAISDNEVKQLAKFGPTIPVHNWRKRVVGQGRPCFELRK